VKPLLAAETPKLRESERVRISQFIEAEFGIKMPEAKKSLLEGRLGKRLAATGMRSYGEYFDFVTADLRGRDEFLRFVDLVSTHETSFFREPAHFDFLAQQALPKVAAVDGGPVTVLSSACSTGEEVYSLAMVVAAGLRQLRRAEFDFTVEGMDLSERAVAIAQRGVYLAERVKTVPPALAREYLMRSRDPQKNLRRVVPEIRRRTSFHPENLLTGPAFHSKTYDIVFCRNVLIYFEPANQRKVIQGLLNRLKPHGYLFLGHSETMVSLDLGVRSVANAVYQRL